MEYDLRDVLMSRDLQGLFGLEIVHQTYPHACACACVATILRNLGMYASERMVVEALTPNAVIGVKPERIIEYLSGKGLMANAQSHYPFSTIVTRTQAGKPSMIRRTDRGDHWIMPVAVEPIMGMVVFADPSMPDTGGPHGSALSCVTVEEATRSWKPLDVVVLVSRPSDYMAQRAATKRRKFRIQHYAGDRFGSAPANA
jgi:hypothetical protein